MFNLYDFSSDPNDYSVEVFNNGKQIVNKNKIIRKRKFYKEKPIKVNTNNRLGKHQCLIMHELRGILLVY